MTSLHIKQNNWIELVEYLYIHFNISLLWWWSKAETFWIRGLIDLIVMRFVRTTIKINVDISLKTYSACLRWTFHNLIVIINSFCTLLRHSGFTTYFRFFGRLSLDYFSFRLEVHFWFDFSIENSPTNESPIGLLRFEKLENIN